MKIEELDKYLAEHSDLLSWYVSENDRYLYVKHEADSEKEFTSIDMSKLKEIDIKQLHKKLVGCRDVDHITRVTGYFSKTSGWNKGKTGELKDRVRNGHQLGQVNQT